MELTAYQLIFIGEYLKDFNASASATRARALLGEKPHAFPQQEGWRLLQIPLVAEEVARCKAQVIEKVKLSVDDVVQDIKNTLSSDPRKLVDHVRGCCRHCYGVGHEYQFTPAEFKRTEKAYYKSKDYALSQLPFDPLGGIGFDCRKDPIQDCPECQGEGVMRIVAKDTRSLGEAEAQLYMGVKPGKNGTEILMRSKDAAREAAAKYLGMNKVNLNVDVSFKAKDLSDDDLAAIAKGAIVDTPTP